MRHQKTFPVVQSRYSTQDTGQTTQDTRHKTQDKGHKDTRHRTEDTGHWKRDKDTDTGQGHRHWKGTGEEARSK